MNSNYVICKYGNMVYKIALRYLKNKYDAEDIVQDVFIKYINELRLGKNFRDEVHVKS